MAVDNAGHLHGPESVEVRNAVEGVDEAIGEAMRGLEDKGMLDCKWTNINWNLSVKSVCLQLRISLSFLIMEWWI